VLLRVEYFLHPFQQPRRCFGIRLVGPFGSLEQANQSHRLAARPAPEVGDESALIVNLHERRLDASVGP